MHCPSCYTRLEIADRSGIEIDYCPSCRGVWLDKGELDKIIERTAVHVRPQAATVPARDYGEYEPRREESKSRREDDKPKRKKKKKKMEWLEEIFDIFD